MVVRCPVHQADVRLFRFLNAHAKGGEVAARLKLSAPVPAIATITARHNPAEKVPSYSVSWAPEGAGPYPTFVGGLWIRAMDDDDSFELILDGRSEPPLGAGGQTLSRRGGLEVADAIAAQLVGVIARNIESAFDIRASAVESIVERRAHSR